MDSDHGMVCESVRNPHTVRAEDIAAEATAVPLLRRIRLNHNFKSHSECYDD